MDYVERGQGQSSNSDLRLRAALLEGSVGSDGLRSCSFLPWQYAPVRGDVLLIDVEHPWRDVVDAIDRLESDAARSRQRHIDHLERQPTLGAAASVLNDRADDDTDRRVLAVVGHLAFAAEARHRAGP
ncbi:hypothetical protein [Roseateles sp.]|uniref:hypothetical protein n=1 Tax=Roseateles sp. TaxID=1971397 RepID=UPI00286AC954|nr:hypothetical protein [Roseateles sp.]